MQLRQEPRVAVRTNQVGLTIVGTIFVGAFITALFFIGGMTSSKNTYASGITTYTSTGNGNWSTHSFSSSGSGDLEVYIIRQGDTITVDDNTDKIDSLTVNGVLVFEDDEEVKIEEDGYVYVGGFGKVIGGDDDSEFNFHGSGAEDIEGPFNISGPTAATMSSGVFSPFYLPVEFVSFEAEVNGNLLELDWTTALEENNSHFEIEYSVDGLNFELADYAYSKATNGNSNEIIAYDHRIDASFLNDASTFYVRLKQIDFNGNHTFSKVVRLTQTTEKRLILGYLGNNEVKVSYNGKFGSDLTVYDLKGAVVYSSKLIGSEIVKFDLPGMYIIECRDQGKTLVEKVIIR